MKNVIRKIILVVCVCVFLYSAFQLGKIFYDYHQIEKQTEEIVAASVKEETDTPEDRVIDFEYLKNINSDVIGWLYIPNTNIDEPILKGKDNDEYLYHDIYKKYNKAGSIFIDEINKGDFTDDNTIIYGHNMKNGSRFHNLRYFINKDNYFEDHPNVYIYLPDGSVNIYDVYGASVLDSYSDLYSKGNEYADFIKRSLAVSSKTRDVSSKEAPIVMLSTCYGGDSQDRYVIFARLKENVK